MIRGIPSSEIAQEAARLAPFLADFAARSQERTTAVQLFDALMAQEMQAWVCGDWQAVCLTTVHPAHVEINCCGGSDREEWQDALEAEIAAWGRHMGKKRVIMIARPGWSKWAKAKGYALRHVELVKELG